MVGINDLFGFALVLAAGSTLLRRNGDIPYSYQLANLPITKSFYQARQAVNFEAVQDITEAQDRLQNIRSQTLKQEKFKTEAQVGILEAEKSKAGALISQLQKIVQTGYRHETYSPRVRGIIMNKRGYDPVKPELIEKGQQAKTIIPQITNIVQKLDENILSLRKKYSSLEAL
jgi:hypothetical protein